MRETSHIFLHARTAISGTDSDVFLKNDAKFPCFFKIGSQAPGEIRNFIGRFVLRIKFELPESRRNTFFDALGDGSCHLHK